MEKNKMLAIIPASGLGTRMNLKPYQAKEMLSDPSNGDKPLIQWSLDLVQNPLVVSREDKEPLNQYCENNKIELLTVKETKEWPDTVLETISFWDDKNVLILPDTRFQPTDILEQIEKQLETNDLVFAIHEVDDVRNWGKVLLDPFSKKPIQTQEKAGIEFKLEGNAWGLIGFKKHVGEALFQAYSDRKIFNLTKLKVSVIYLTSFKDICRTGQIEQYE